MRTLPLAALLLAAVPFLPQDPQPAATPKPAAPAAQPAARPADVASIEAIVAALYDVISGPAGKAREWDRMRSLFMPEAHLLAMVKARDGKGMRTVVLTVDDYVQRSGPMLEKNGFFEQEIARKVDRFGDLAHAFSTYESRHAATDKEPFMRGINSIQLVHQQDRWWIAQVLWEQETDAGPIPQQYLPEKK